jgi:hypothetical protein
MTVFSPTRRLRRMPWILPACVTLLLGAAAASSQAQAPAATPAAIPAAIPVPMNEIYPLGKAWPAPKVLIDVSGAPQARAWADEARTLVQQWFPIVCRYLDTDNYTPPKTYTLVFKNMNGVAYTTGMGSHNAETVISVAWITAHPEDFGMVIHEMTHVIQGYSGQTYGAAGWLVEGEADYVRFYKYEPDVPRDQVIPSNPQTASYKDGYRTTASFISYVTWKYNRGLLFDLDTALRAGTYTDADWQTITGKSLSDLWAEYVAVLSKHPGA